MKVGYIGLGIMGRPCVENLLKAGFEVRVFARNPQKNADLAERGVQFVSSAKALAQQVDILITNVSDTPDVQALIMGEDGILASHAQGLIVVDMSTIAPLAAKTLGAELAAQNIHFLDCPVSGGEAGAIAGSLTMMIGGDAEVLDRARPVLSAMGKTITLIGPNGAGQIAKACNQIGVGVGIAMVAEMMKLCDAAGVNPRAVREALLGGFAASKVLDVHGLRMIEDNYAPGFKAKLHLKDMHIVNQTAQDLGIELALSKDVLQKISDLVKEGDGELDSSAIARKIIKS